MKKNILLVIPVLIFLLIFNAFNGNPFSEKLAQSAVEKYIEENHPGYEVKRQWYDWISRSYCADVWIPDSMDCIFNITVGHFGNIRYSDYKYTVANNFNTHLRAGRMYSEMCEPIIDKFTHESERPEGVAHHGSFGGADLYDLGGERILQPPFENDKEYTKEEIDALASEYGYAFIYLKELPRSDITAEKLADTILQVKNEFDSNNLKFNKITVQLSGNECGIYWMGIPYEIINEQDILQLTKENSTFEEY